MDLLAAGHRIKCLTCADGITKKGLTVNVAFGMSGVQVTLILDNLARFGGYPATMRTAQMPVFICKALDQWAYEHEARLRLIQPNAQQVYFLLCDHIYVTLQIKYSEKANKIIISVYFSFKDPIL